LPPVTFGPAAANQNERRREAAIFGHLLDVGIERAGPPGSDETFETQLTTKGLIDTGASDICIDFRLAERLGLKMIDQTMVGVVGATVPAKIYLGRVVIPEIGFDRLMRLYALRVRHATHEVLLGRSLLQNYIVTFNGPAGIYTFATPADFQAHSTIEDDFAT
jgi:predicted aspartyl protease